VSIWWKHHFYIISDLIISNILYSHLALVLCYNIWTCTILKTGKTNLVRPWDNHETCMPCLSLTILVRHNKDKNNIFVIRYLSGTGFYNQNRLSIPIQCDYKAVICNTKELVTLKCFYFFLFLQVLLTKTKHKQTGSKFFLDQIIFGNCWNS
jgi:hypothetical protein